jgi:hypothetical protein
MVLRWVAGAYLLTEKNFRKLMGYRDLWALAAILGRAKKSAGCETNSVLPKEQFA